MSEDSFVDWWLGRVKPFAEVDEIQLKRERQAAEKQQQFNENYADFLNGAILPGIDELVKIFTENQIVHRVSSWGNQLSLRVHLSWRWGELVIMQSHEDCVTFMHRIITESDGRGEESDEEHSHAYDLNDALPPTIARQELQFFLGRMAQDLVERDDDETDEDDDEIDII